MKITKGTNQKKVMTNLIIIIKKRVNRLKNKLMEVAIIINNTIDPDRIIDMIVRIIIGIIIITTTVGTIAIKTENTRKKNSLLILIQISENIT